ncbi:hypothetical protein B296_00029560 [Ensete ventricosum]|uniref:Uncharacterized protein n=1 Tax=Ensete ventricosum TaxID=4639 RepID=A0A426XD15_ENSVE|nr:hypothetical protein B296_00029560 [Ensete ventricosum]
MDIDEYTGAEVLRAGVDEVEEGGAAVKHCEEESGIGLGLGVLDPLQARADGASIAASLPQHPASMTSSSSSFSMAKQSLGVEEEGEGMGRGGVLKAGIGRCGEP